MPRGGRGGLRDHRRRGGRLGLGRGGRDALLLEVDAELRELGARGHRIRTDPAYYTFGRGQMIVRLDNGVLVGGTESRTDSNIACY